MNMKKTLSSAGFTFLTVYLIIAGAVYLDSQWIDTLDMALINLIQSQITESGAALVSVLTEAGRAQLIIIFTMIISSVLLIRKMFVAGIWFGASVLIFAIIFTLIAKMAISRERPDYLVLAAGQSQSFPSGHTAAATVFYGLAAICLILIVRNLWKKIAIATIAFLIIIFVMFSRIYLGAHFPTDVLGGFTQGMAGILISASIYQPLSIHLKERLLRWNLHDKSPAFFNH